MRTHHRTPYTIIIEGEMSSMKVLERILSADMSEDIKKHKKKKSKKAKRKKMDQEILRAKNEQWMKDYAEFCESAVFTQCPDIKKKKKGKKKTEDSLSEAFQPPLKPRKKLKLKRHKRHVDSSYALPAHPVSQPSLGEQKQMQVVFGKSFESLTQKDKVQNKKRVTFSLSPVLIPPKPPHNPFAVRDKTQPSGVNKPASVNTQDKSFYKLSVEENPMESQSTAEDFSSQDLFITQRSLLDHYTEICSSASTADRACQTYRPSSQDKPASRHKPEASTQTENFFTAPVLTTSVRICRRRTCGEEPLDLSLPNRFRVCRPELKRELTSSDDSDIVARSKSDLSHLKVVQTRLNESFFFKVKGDVESPNPMSPLMKLTGSVEKKK